MSVKVTTQKVEKTVEVVEETEDYTCDRCGAACSDDINKVEIDGLPWVVKYELYGDPDSCVSMRVFREFCQDCAKDVEKELMEALGLRPNPNGEYDDVYRDRFWGSYEPDYEVERKVAT